MATRWYPQFPPEIHSSVQDAVRKLFDGIYTLRDSLSQVVKKVNVPSPAPSSPTVVDQQAYALLQAGSSQPLRQANATILPIVSGKFFYDNATAGTIKWYSTGLQILWPDGATTTITDTTAGSPLISVSGLTSGTTYKFYPRYNIYTELVEFVIGADATATGTPAAAYPSTGSTAAARLQNSDGYKAMSVGGMSAAATSGGGGGGSGGGSGNV